MSDTPIFNMRDVASDILDIQFSPEMTLDDCKLAFYQVMRKHGIKKGRRETITTAHGESNSVVTYNSPEWTFCMTLFVRDLQGYMDMHDHWSQIPQDLRI